MFSGTLEKFKRLTKHPERYLQTQNNVAEEIKLLLKDVYDYTKKQEINNKNQLVLPELIIEDFDDEQIWQEIELQNSLKYSKLLVDISYILASKDNLCFKFLNEGSGLREESSGASETENVDDEDSSFPDKHGKNTLFEENSSSGTKRAGRISRKIQPSIVDDNFFKLSELEEFLNKEDRKENQNDKKKRKSNNDTDESEESVDLFEDLSSENNEEEEGAHYDEFFDAPVDLSSIITNQKKSNQQINEDESEDEEQSQTYSDCEADNGNVEDKQLRNDGNHEKKVRFDISSARNIDSDEEDSGGEDKNVKKDDSKQLKSTFETRQERIQTIIKGLEEKALSEKSWQLKGEVSALSRPQNSLLEEVLEFDSATRPAPVITEQTTLKLEDIILQRIKDKSWDDVERKVKPTMAPDEYKKKVVMDQEKSKISLAEIYEQDYLKQKEALDPESADKVEEEPQEHRTIRSMTSALFAKLDALTNFHYTPKPVIPEIKIISNLPAITMEEVAPVATSDATLLAPEEVKTREKGDIIGKEERTKTDKKRERRSKKKKQKMKQKEKEQREKIVQKLRPGLGNKYSKEKALEDLKKISNDKNVHQLMDDGKDKGVRSSSAFFSSLQEEVASGAKRKLQQSKKKQKEQFAAKKLKL